MPSAMILSSPGDGVPNLPRDLRAAGFDVVCETARATLVQDAVRCAPDVLVCFETHPEPALFRGISALMEAAARPVIVFTTDPDADNIVLATQSGVHAYVIDGYHPRRLRPVIHLAQARFRQESSVRTALVDLQRRFAERTLVDRAKGILMGARQLREEEAFRALRTAAMASKRRIGQLSQLVIDSANYADSINRAGQLRMFSQRLVKLYALRCAGLRGADTLALFAGSLAQVDDTLASLGRALSQPTFGDLIEAIAAPWEQLRVVLEAPVQAGRLVEVDGLAEQMLDRAEQLTANLEVAAYAAALHVINVAGRQRMLSQRVVKAVLIASLVDGPAGRAAAVAGVAASAQLDGGLAYLQRLPLTNPAISAELAQAATIRAALADALPAAGTPEGCAALAVLSEALLGHFNTITAELERGMHAMAGLTPVI